jgi:PAS domain S-box-containing protein
MDLQLEAIINSLDDGIVCVDDQQCVVFLNDAAARTFGCQRGALPGQPLARCPALAAAWRQLNVAELQLASGSSKAVRRLEGRRPKGEAFPLEALVSCTTVGGRQVFTAVIRDVSRQQQMEHAVHQARKHQAVGALASGIAHDFNNILTAIISHLDLTLYAPECPAALKSSLIAAQASARRGAELVNRLQMFSRQTRPKFAPVDLAEVLAQVVFVLRRSIDPRIEIHCAPPRAPVWLVKADTSQMMHALVNLGLNARDAMPDGGRLTIELAGVAIPPAEERPPRRAGEFVRLTVADTGHGMAPELAARVFEPYFTTKDASRGPGLGLSITFGIVAEHGGWMEVESREGQGTRFHLFLPRTTEAVPVAPARELLATETRALEGRERLLIADDEEPVRLVMRAVLSYRGYEVSEAGDGEEAVRKCLEASPPFDLVLMDLHMPKLNGRDALVKIRERQPRLKAVLLSGGLQEREPESALELEGVRFLHKPFENQELVTLVRQTLDAAPGC